MRPMLYCLNGSLKGSTMSPTGSIIVLGTDPDCEVRFPPSDSHPVAARHAMIKRTADDFFVRGIGGEDVFINDKSVKESKLRPSDVMQPFE